MIDQLINMGKQQLSESLKKDQNLNDQQVDETFNVAKSSMLDGLKNQAMSGNFSQITSLFNGNTSNSSFLNNDISKNFINQLAPKLGISPERAGSIAAMVIPFLISKFASKETGTADDDGGLLSKLGIDTGGIMSGLGGKLGGLFK